MLEEFSPEDKFDADFPDGHSHRGKPAQIIWPKMTAQYAKANLSEEKAFELVQELVTPSPEKPGSETPSFFSVDHRQKPEQLMVSLLFYVFWSRRKGKFACQPLLELVNRRLFFTTDCHPGHRRIRRSFRPQEA